MQCHLWPVWMYIMFLVYLINCTISGGGEVIENKRFVLIFSAVFIWNMSHSKAPSALSVKMSDFTVWRHTRRKNWVNCAVLTGNSAGPQNCPFPVVFRTENCAVHSGNPTVSSVYLPTPRWHFLKAPVSINSFSWSALHDIFLFKYHFLLHIIRFLFFFSDNIMADVANKQQTTALFLSTTVTRTRIHTELINKLTNLMGNLCCAREHSVQFFVQLFIQLNYTV